MTVAAAFASKLREKMIGAAADSRVTRASSFTDDAQKVLVLGRSSIMTAAGRANDVVRAVQITNSEIQRIDRKRVKHGRCPTSVWHHAGLLFENFGNLRTSSVPSGNTTLIVAGFLSNGDPIIAQCGLTESGHERYLFKPQDG